MAGPLPKANARARRNRSSQALSAPETITVPPLPELEGWTWLPPTIAWWERIWASEMADQWIESDVDGLYILALLVNRQWQEPGNTALATEIRLQRACFGLDTYARRRLDWKIAPPADDAPKPKRAKAEGEADPRDYLDS